MTARSQPPRLAGTWETTGWRGAAIALAVLAVLGGLYLARDVFKPVALALVLSFLLQPAVRALCRRRIQRGVAATMVMVGLLGAVGLGLAQIYEPAMKWVEKAPASLQHANEKLRTLLRPVMTVGRAAEQVEKFARPAAETGNEVVELKKPSLRDAMFRAAPRFVVTALVTIFLLYFLLACGPELLNKLLALLPGGVPAGEAAEMMQATEHEISRYLATITLINAGLGAAIGEILVGLAALLTFENAAYALAAPAAYLGLASIEGMWITPLILGKRFDINPLVVFVWLLFWGWLWGVTGALLAMPMLSIAKIIGDHVSPLQPFSRLISRE